MTGDLTDRFRIGSAENGEVMKAMLTKSRVPLAVSPGLPSSTGVPAPGYLLLQDSKA